MENIAVLNLPAEQIDCSSRKNNFIAEHRRPYLAFVNSDKITERQVMKALEREEILSYGDVVVLCAGEIQNPAQLAFEDVLECFPLQIAALVFKRELLAVSGSYNDKLQALTDFELLCRLTEAAGSCLFVFPGIEEDELEIAEEDVYTYAYLIRRYLRELRAWGKTERLLQSMYQAANYKGLLSVFQKYLNYFLESEESFERIAAVTAPFVIFRGDSTCHGVLRDFADSLGNSLRAVGQAVIMAEAEGTDYEYFLHHVCKAFVGFQSVAIGIDFFRKKHGPKLQFWLDNPIFYARQFSEFPKEYYILCQDADYAEFIKEQYHLKNALQFPPGGHLCRWTWQDERPYDIVFVGSFIPEEDVLPERTDRDYYEYMIRHPGMTFSSGLREFLKERGAAREGDALFDELRSMKSVCQSVINHYRKKVIDTIIDAGFEVHVYGDSWNAYRSPNAHRLIRHPEVSVEASLGEWQKAKIGLNIMSWHKAGMTERVANIMLSGAVCLSDETEYLKTHFAEGEQIVCYDLEHLEELPQKIEELLRDEKRAKIAYEGYRAAACGHTWDHRAVELIKMTEDIWEGQDAFCHR